MRPLLLLVLLLTACGSDSGRDQPSTTAQPTVTQPSTEATPVTDDTADPPPPDTGDSTPATTASGDPTPREPIAWIVLEDIQGLYGGHAVYVWPDGRLVARVVRPPEGGRGPGLQERRYEARLSAAQLEELSTLLAERDFARLVIDNRLGIPDEAYADIRVRWQSGRTARAGKWAGERNERFGAVQGWLMGRVRQAAEGSPTFEGAYDYGSRPDGPWTADWAP